MLKLNSPALVPSLLSWLRPRPFGHGELNFPSARRATLQTRRSILRKLAKRMTQEACIGS